MSKHYRLEAWFQVLDEDEMTEDELEEGVKENLISMGITCQGGPVVFQIFPNGSDGTPWSR